MRRRKIFHDEMKLHLIRANSATPDVDVAELSREEMARHLKDLDSPAYKQQDEKKNESNYMADNILTMLVSVIPSGAFTALAELIALELEGVTELDVREAMSRAADLAEIRIGYITWEEEQEEEIEEEKPRCHHLGG